MPRREHPGVARKHFPGRPTQGRPFLVRQHVPGELVGRSDHALTVSAPGRHEITRFDFRGYPVMAMVRLPTPASDGKANLHQGAVGAGIDLVTGWTLTGVSGTAVLDEHPAIGHPIAGLHIPGWENLLSIAARSYEMTGLGYLGVDLVLDRTLGPLMLELNARPGLAIQIANRRGLWKRLRVVEGEGNPKAPMEERAEFSRERFRHDGE